MVFVAKGAGQWPDAAAFANECYVIHSPDVHITRTHVNVECVPEFYDIPYVADDESVGAALTRLRERAGLSMRELASAAKYSHASGIQRYVDANYEGPLPLKIAQKFIGALSGRGSPPIADDEVMRLTGLSTGNAVPFKMEGASDARMRHDVPVFGTALGAAEVYDGEAVEQTTLNSGEIIAYLRRPVLLDGRADVYGLYVQGSSMAPRYRDGATVFVEQKKPPRIGDDAVIYLRVADDHDGERASCVLIKTLARKTASYIELEQYSPALSFQIPVERIERMDRVVPWDELVA